MTPTSDQALSALAVETIRRMRLRKPRVQCLVNTVAQPIVANVLLAAGARVSMAVHPDEVVAMTRGADALLINLGTPDAARLDAIQRLMADARVLELPRVLDPVFVEHSPVRHAVARAIIAAGAQIVKGNAAELAALDLPANVTRVETGAVDRISGPGHETPIEIARGSHWMAMVTGLGCAAGALIAACAAVDDDAVRASAAALWMFAIAGEGAAKRAAGPGSFATAFIDEIAGYAR